MTKLNMTTESTKPIITPAPASAPTVKADEVKAPVATPAAGPAASATVHQK
jgi:hypothetical protein